MPSRTAPGMPARDVHSGKILWIDEPLVVTPMKYILRMSGALVGFFAGLVTRRLRRDRHAGGGHYFGERGNCLRRGLVIPETMSLGDDQRRPSVLVFPVPDLNFRALGSQEFHRSWQVLISGTVHGGLAVVVNGVDI